MSHRVLLVLAIMFCGVMCGAAPSVGAESEWQWPVATHHLVNEFQAPPTPYAAGHRGIDIRTTIGAPVTAVGAGTVAFAGHVGGIPVVSVDHGDVRSTYQPVAANVRAGKRVAAGTVIGHAIQAGSHCGVLTCVHLGVKRGAQYIDPLTLLRGHGTVRLISPHGPVSQYVIADFAEAMAGGGSPVAGARRTSGFGWRIHPIHGGRRFHDGVDFGAPCGTPVRSTNRGVVRRAAWAGGYGNRVEVSHGGGRVSSYSHLSAFAVRAGQRVARGEVLGRVGTTGQSTGCHLHYSVHLNGKAVNPG